MNQIYKASSAFLLASLFTSGLMAAELRFVGSDSMAVGNTWSYDMAVILWDNDPVNFSGTGTITVTGTQVIGAYNASVALIDSPWGIMTKYYYQTEDALLLLGSGSASNNVHRVYRNLDPLEVKPVWIDTSANNYHFGHGEYNVNQDDPAYSWTETKDSYVTYLQPETVTVPAGSFECITVMIRTDWTDSDGFYGYEEEVQSHDPAIGIIKTESYEWYWDEWSQTSSATEYTWELISTNVTPYSYLDDFDDNIMGSEWVAMSSNEDNFWLDETNQRLEVRSVSESDNDFALYIPNGWHLDTSQDFGIKIRYYNELDSEMWSELLFALGDSSDIENNHLQFSVCSLDDGENTGPHFYYELVQNSSEIDDLYVTRDPNDGWIFISYDAVLDEVYFGVDGYGSANSLKTVSGLLQGDWAGMDISPHLGGSSDHVEILSGQAYWDDFTVDYGEIINLTVDTPIQNELWAKGQSHEITWSTTNHSPGVRIELLKGGEWFSQISEWTPNDGSHSWWIPWDLPTGTDYQVKVICWADESAADFSDPFEIVGPCDLYTPVSVSMPGGGTSWEMGDSPTIQWAGGDSLENVDIQLWKGNQWITAIAKTTTNTGSHTWTEVPYWLTPGTDYKVRVQALGADCDSLVDFSEEFTVGVPSVDVSLPNSSTVLTLGDPDVPITWTGDFSGDARIVLFKGDTWMAGITWSTANTGSFSWGQVPYWLPAGTDYRVKVMSLNNKQISGFSESFEIKGPIDVAIQSSVTAGDTNVEITWTGDLMGTGRIALFKGDTWMMQIAPSVSGTAYTWQKVPHWLPTGTDYRVKVISNVNSNIYGLSNDFAVIVPPIAVAMPTSGTEWKRAHKYEIHWTGGNTNKGVYINLLKAGVKVKTITDWTANDGVHSWWVPTDLEIGSDYTIEVVYWPDTSIRDTSETFSVLINSVDGSFMDITMFNGGIGLEYDTFVYGDFYRGNGSGIAEVYYGGGGYYGSEGSVNEWIHFDTDPDNGIQEYQWSDEVDGVHLTKYHWPAAAGYENYSFNFNTLVVPTELEFNRKYENSSPGTGRHRVYGINYDLTGTAETTCEIIGVEYVWVKGVEYEAYKIKFSLAINSVSNSYSGWQYTGNLYQGITYWAVPGTGVVKSNINYYYKVTLSGLGYEIWKSYESRELIN